MWINPLTSSQENETQLTSHSWLAGRQIVKVFCVCVCSVCVCTSSLVDPFLPRSSRRPSPFLLQDAHPSSVHGSLHLQTPAAASIVPPAPDPLHPTPPPQHSQKKKKENTHPPTHTQRPTHTHRFTSRALMCSPLTCDPRIYPPAVQTHLSSQHLSEDVKASKKIWAATSPQRLWTLEQTRDQDLLQFTSRCEIKGLWIWGRDADTKEPLCPSALKRRKKNKTIYIYINIYHVTMCNGLYICDIKLKMYLIYLAFVACLNMLSFYISVLFICLCFHVLFRWFVCC